jgi:beta-lactam-binding protein with PASTA domain
VTVVTASDAKLLEDYSGMVYQEVAAMLSGDPYGFAVEPIYVMAKEPGQEGRIEKQNPKAGTEWEKGMFITLTVYTEGMIDMKGMTAQDARSFIEQKGWVYKEVPGEYIDDATAGTVLSTDPKGGTFPESGATITVTVAAGKEEPTTEAPTEPPTDTPTDPPTDTPTEPPTDTTTQAPTEKPTEKPTDKPTEPPTDAPTEPPTDAPTEPPVVDAKYVPLALDFKNKTGVNFIDYLTNIRIERAKELLADSDVSIKEICSEVGYADPNYFSRIFKKVTGVTPTEYKEVTHK